jgi:ankyrin repeat protein
MSNGKRLFTAIGFAWSGLVLAAGPENLSDTFYTAIRANDLARLESRLKDAASANTKDSRGVTPLMYAAAVGSLEAMNILIDGGADVNARNAFDSTVLIWSAADLPKVRLLIEHGADVNAASKQGRTPLLVAAMSEGSAPILRLLISKGANVRAVDAMKTTALLAACGGQTSGVGSGARRA